MISANTHTIRLEYKRGNAWFLVNILVGVLLFLPVVSASDVQVWQGQYFKGTVFQVGTFPFNFSVYNDKFGGNACYSSSVNLTTGNFGEWRTEQTSVGMACDNTSSDYYLEIIINGEIQSPRRLMKNFDFLRKNVNEQTTGSIQAVSSDNTTILSPNLIEVPVIRAKLALKELNKDVWKQKLGYAEELANITLVNNINLAELLINTTKNFSQHVVGENIDTKKNRLLTVAQQANSLVRYNANIARGLLTKDRQVTLLNGETANDTVLINQVALDKENLINASALLQLNLIDSRLNDSLADVDSLDTGVRFCLSNGSNCNNLSFLNLSGTNANQNVNVGSYNFSANSGFFVYLGSLVNRISKMFVQDVDVNGTIQGSGSINISGNITGGSGFFNFLGSLTNRINTLSVQSIDFSGNINGTGTMTAANVFVPQYIQAATQVNQAIVSINVFQNITYDDSRSEIKQGIIHNPSNNTNNTFTIATNGIYQITYTHEVMNTANNNDISARVTRNGIEINGSLMEVDPMANADAQLTNTFIANLSTNDNLNFQFASDVSTVSLKTEFINGNHQTTSVISIRRIA